MAASHTATPEGMAGQNSPAKGDKVLLLLRSFNTLPSVCVTSQGDGDLLGTPWTWATRSSPNSSKMRDAVKKTKLFVAVIGSTDF